MPVIAPFIVGAIGLTGTAAAIGEAVIGVGLSLGTGYLANKLSPQPSTNSYPGMRLFVSYETNGPRQIPFGLVADAGVFTYHNVYGPNGNDYVQFIYKLGDVPCTSLEGMFVNGLPVTLGSEASTTWVSGRTVTEFPNAMWIEFHDGAWDQDADADLVARATGGEWSANYRGRGVCYVHETMKFDAKLYVDGRPNFLFVYKGAKLYDWRKDSSVGGSGSHRWGDESTYEWTDNPRVCLYNFKSGIYVNGSKVGGMNVPAASQPLDIATATANACDEAVTLKAGGTEKRYRLGGLVPVDRENATVVRDMNTAMAGVPSESGGVFKFYAGVAQASVLSFTDDDLTSTDDVTFAPKQSRSGLVNAVFGSFNDPSKLYKSSDLPPRISADDAVSDGNTELTKSYALTYVSSGTQGQRILEILRRRGRFQRNLTLKMGAIGAILESGDWVTWNSARYAFSDVTFIVVQATLNRDFTVSLELQETSESIYAWDAATDELDPLNPHDVGPGGEKFSTVQGVALETIIVDAGNGLQRPGLHLTWTPVDDPTVLGLQLEYRRVGDTAALKSRIEDATTGQYTWVSGIQSGVDYEARLDLITAPERPTVFTAWISSADSTGDQIVAVAALANSVPPDTITPEMLDAQSRFELGLITAVDTTFGSISAGVKDVTDQSKAAAEATIRALIAGSQNQDDIRTEKTQRISDREAFASKLETITASLQGVSAQITQEITARTTADSSQASDIETLVSQLGDNVSALTILSQTIDGLMSRLTFAFNQNGAVVGLIDFAAENGVSSLNIDVANFFISLMGVAGGDPVPVFAIQNVNGSPKLVWRGDMIGDGSITAKQLNVASIATLRISDPANTYYYDFSTGKQGSTNGKFLIDMAAGRILATP